MLWVDNKSSDDPYLNLALEEYLVRNKFLTQPLLLLYINKKAVVVGKNQNIWKEVNIEYARNNNILLTRRLSGGGAVYHDPGNLNYSIISPFNSKLLNNFKEIVPPLLSVLSDKNIPVYLNERGDIESEGFKVSGTAQFTNRKNILSHGTLLILSNLDHLRNSLHRDFDSVETRAIESKRSRVINLDQWADVNIGSLKNEIRNAFDALEEFPLTEEDWIRIQHLRISKFQSVPWILERSPSCVITHSIELKGRNYLIEFSIDKGYIRNYELSLNEKVIAKEEDIDLHLCRSEMLKEIVSPDFLKIWQIIEPKLL